MEKGWEDWVIPTLVTLPSLEPTPTAVKGLSVHSRERDGTRFLSGEVSLVQSEGGSRLG